MKPNNRNFCGGAFADWLEVNLIKECNASCPWCIERTGFHPSGKADWRAIANAAINERWAKNIMLLGGEPTLYKEISNLIGALVEGGKRVMITTNGLRLSPQYVLENLRGVYGVNISVHHYDPKKNKEITGILIDIARLKEAIATLRHIGAYVRMNCNAISEYIDNEDEIIKYIRFAKEIGADKVRFAELKQDDNNFVDLAKSMDYRYGLNDDPFTCGCNTNCIIENVPVNFRQMCGLQTNKRLAPTSPEQANKKVLYYDGKIYMGWQQEKEIDMTPEENEKIKSILKRLAAGEISIEEAQARIEQIKTRVVLEQSGGGCQY